MPLLAGGDCHQPSSVVPRPLARWSAARRRREVTVVVVLSVQRMMANRSGGGRGPCFRARIMNASRLSQLAKHRYCVSVPICWKKVSLRGSA